MDGKFRTTGINDEPTVTEPVPVPVTSRNHDDGQRLWIGNLSEKLNEFQLLKILQKFGKLKRYDYLYHTNGVDKGKPRRYAFATFHDHPTAEKAKRHLNGQMVLSSRLFVKWAHEEREIIPERKSITLAGTGLKENTEVERDTKSAIEAIEAKLRSMERKEDSLPVPLVRLGVTRPVDVKSGRRETERSSKPYKRSGYKSNR